MEVVLFETRKMSYAIDSAFTKLLDMRSTFCRGGRRD